MSTRLNGSIQTHFRTIDGLSIRFAESEDRADHALLLSPWPESVYAFEAYLGSTRRIAFRSQAEVERLGETIAEAPQNQARNELPEPNKS